MWCVFYINKEMSHYPPIPVVLPKPPRPALEVQKEIESKRDGFFNARELAKKELIKHREKRGF